MCSDFSSSSFRKIKEILFSTNQRICWIIFQNWKYGDQRKLGKKANKSNKKNPLYLRIKILLKKRL